MGAGGLGPPAPLTLTTVYTDRQSLYFSIYCNYRETVKKLCVEQRMVEVVHTMKHTVCWPEVESIVDRNAVFLGACAWLYVRCSRAT